MTRDIAHISKMIKAHYDATPWLDVNLLDTLNKIDARVAAHRISSCNSIWQITWHLTAWRETLLKRINNEACPTPANNFIDQVDDTSTSAWLHLMKRLDSSQQAILNWLNENETIALDEKTAGGNYTRRELLEAITLHDTYHLGQIILLQKIIEQETNSQLQ